MCEDYSLSSTVNAAASTSVKHVNLQDLSSNATYRLYKGGLRPGDTPRTSVQAQEMLDKIPHSQRAGINSESAAKNVEKYLDDKHASHIKPHSQGGSNNPDNIVWENGKDNIARGNKPITTQEQMRLKAKYWFDNLNGGVRAGLEAAPLGAAIGAISTLPFSLLTHGLSVVRGETTADEAAKAVLKDTAIGTAVGGAIAFTITALATACPPIAIALTVASPVLAVAGTEGMIHEFFKILKEHKQAVRIYYESLTQHELARLEAIENELIYEHWKNLEFLAEARAVNQEINERPITPGMEGAMRRLNESIALAKSLEITSSDSKLLNISSNLYLPPTL